MFQEEEFCCHYCGKIGHSINKCFIGNNPYKFKQIWVPKNVVSTNINGPTKVWVPKEQLDCSFCRLQWQFMIQEANGFLIVGAQST